MKIFILAITTIIIYCKDITEDDFKDTNLLSSSNWLPYLPTQAFNEAINYQGCQLERVPQNISDTLQFTPTWVSPQVDTSRIKIVVVSGSGYADHGQISINNSLLNFQVDFTFQQAGSNPIYGGLTTGQEPINYTVNLRQNNQSITYNLDQCLNLSVQASIYELRMPGFNEMQKVELANQLNQIGLLPKLINAYYQNHSDQFCQKVQFFVEEASIPSSIIFKLDQYIQPSESNPRVIEAIETIRFQGLQLQKQVYTEGLNIEIFNYQSDVMTPLDHKYYDNHLYSLEISMELIETYFNYAAENGMFNTILNSTIWPVSDFNYKTADLRKMIPTAYYSFKLNTDIEVDCLQTEYRFIGQSKTAIENNTIEIQLAYSCIANADEINFATFTIDISFNIAVEENKVDNQSIDFINFVVNEYEVISLEFQEIDIYKIWSLNQLKDLVYRGLQQNVPNMQTYGSGWIKNELGNKISYGFTSQTLAIWSLQLL